MYSWYLICYKSRLHRKVIEEMENINVEYYMPMQTKFTVRADRKKTFRSHLTPLFPGYLFVRFSLEVTHTTLIAKQTSVLGFVRLGCDICTVREEIIDSIKRLSFKFDNNKDKLIYVIERNNLSPSIFKEMERIVTLEQPEVRVKVLLHYLSQSNHHTSAALTHRH